MVCLSVLFTVGYADLLLGARGTLAKRVNLLLVPAALDHLLHIVDDAQQDGSKAESLEESWLRVAVEEEADDAGDG